MGITIIGDSKRHIFHYKDCVCVRTIPEKDIRYFGSKDEARGNGYTHCYRCSKLVSYYNKDKDEIDKFILQNYMKMYIRDDAMYIDNITSAWKITTEPTRYGLVLYHANSERISKLKIENKHIQYHYHKQRYKGNKDILSMLRYIVEHDKWKIDNQEKYKDLPKTTKRKKKEYRKQRDKYRKNKVREVKNLIDKVSKTR